MVAVGEARLHCVAVRCLYLRYDYALLAALDMAVRAEDGGFAPVARR